MSNFICVLNNSDRATEALTTNLAYLSKLKYTYICLAVLFVLSKPYSLRVTTKFLKARNSELFLVCAKC